MINKDQDVFGELVWGLFLAVTEPSEVNHTRDAIYFLIVTIVIAAICAAPFIFAQ